MSLAAEQGHRVAQIQLGLFYETGQGVPRDRVRALMWYRLSAEGGHSPAAPARDRLERALGSARSARSKQMAAEWQAQKSGGDS